MEAPWLDEARRHIGVKETPGAASNPIIVQWAQDAGIDWYRKDSDAWCAVAVNGWLVKVGYPSTRSALAKSFLDYGKPLAAPQPGAIVVFNRGDPSSIYGHVAIVETVNGDGTITCVNGNVSDMVKRSVYTVSSIVKGGIRWPVAGGEALAPVSWKLGDRMLRAPMRGDDVLALQQALNVLNYGLLEDGVYGAATETAVKKHQGVNGLLIDGIAGPATISSVVSKAEARKAEKAKVQTATNAAVPAAAAGGGAVATIGAGLEVTRQISSLNDGTIVGALLVLVAVAAIGGFLAWKFWPRSTATQG